MAVTAVAITLGLVFLATVSHSTEVDETALAATPGARSEERTPGTAPFELPDPNPGSSTLPFVDDSTKPLTSSLAPTATTTTTTLWVAPQANGDPVCEGAVTLGTLANIAAPFVDDIPQLRKLVAKQMQIASAQFAEAGGIYTSISNILDERTPLIEKAASLEEMMKLMLPIIQSTEPAMQPALEASRDRFATVCPQLNVR